MKNIDLIKQRIQHMDAYVLSEYLSETWHCGSDCLAQDYCEQHKKIPCRDVIWKWLEEEVDD